MSSHDADERADRRRQRNAVSDEQAHDSQFVAEVPVSLQYEFDSMRIHHPKVAEILDRVGAAGRALGRVDLSRSRTSPEEIPKIN